MKLSNNMIGSLAIMAIAVIVIFNFTFMAFLYAKFHGLGLLLFILFGCVEIAAIFGQAIYSEKAKKDE